MEQTEEPNNDIYEAQLLEGLIGIIEHIRRMSRVIGLNHKTDNILIYSKSMKVIAEEHEIIIESFEETAFTNKVNIPQKMKILLCERLHQHELHQCEICKEEEGSNTERNNSIDLIISEEMADQAI